MPLKMYNTLTRKKEEFIPLSPPLVKMYVCGMTVQDRPHIGHMRAYVVSDIVKRWLTYRGFRVKHIQNVTDIDDKVVEKAKTLGRDYRELAEENAAEFMRCSDIMGIERADFYPRATQHIQEIIELVSRLVQKGCAYSTDTGVYFDISRFPDYGKLSRKRIDDLIKGARVQIDETKHSPLDFALWKRAKEGEPFWESPWGRGRPGWHIECSAMSMKHLGETIDIHMGGEDLIFPHHENEIAQSEAATGKPFARFWLHNGLLRLLGGKMSKSTGEFIPALDVLQRFEPDAVRLVFLSTHYRHPMEYSEARLEEGEEALTRMWECIEMLGEKSEEEEKTKGGYLSDDIANFWKDFEDAMDDDFNTPKAIGGIYSLIKDVNLNAENMDGSTARLYRDTLASSLKILGMRMREKELGVFTPRLLDLILDVRQKLREENKYDLADKIRENLSRLGITIKDTPEGSVWKI
ncbi:cysteine--tRNA ligase [candidate division WOR-3 bacterium JGI_Cruoil_03_44_89]|uniref:Cysteine--tRNA ligase n=1 Tax=candidate division WOR-3 bacterium JGI_Cruoil_03_44_89 TaxID=1973748 RepID=A0A235BT95_UNCW3|nr:MAG: cysteine--tRNA ligase [candidate division WOR-3 bacterium JGI_Cruoil_03_44_89]